MRFLHPLTQFNQGAAALRRMQCVSTLGTDSLRGPSYPLRLDH
jgi:hypothetical protein